MNSTQLSTTVLVPSRLGMPACGHASATTLSGVLSGAATLRALGTGVEAGYGIDLAGISATTVVRDRQDVVVKGGETRAFATAPGTSAWRPPTC